LANALAGQDLEPNEPDIDAEFNSNTPGDWYFGLDGRPPPGQYDFVTVVLHEIAHGLGFSGSMGVLGGQGRWGFSDPPYPRAYDRFTTDSSRRSLVNTSVCPNPSAALASVLQSAVYFDSPLTNEPDGTGRARLYAPSTWETGSSYSHLSEATYRPGHVNSLMTPNLARAEGIHSPGPMAMCMFEAMGWATAESCPPISPPANDDFSRAQVLSGAGGVANGSNVTATKEPQEPSHVATPGAASVWYQWTAPSSGTARFDTAGSSFDTVLAVYTGGALNALTVVAGNDDDSSIAPQSWVSFSAASGQSYRIVVDGYAGAIGAVRLSWALAGGGATGTTVLNVTSSEPGGPITASATGVASANTLYVLKMSTTAESCPASALRLGSSVVSTASFGINPTSRTIPVSATSGVRWLCWTAADDVTNHTAPLGVTIF
ncbi:MAG: hypothetical protein M3144_04990, partial [Actinomycetota bacterium]|nr:hypothetical protein [Actinomycetota bacterium]